ARLRVVTQDAEIEVHGTRFLVERTARGTAVAVDRGSVQVASGTHSVRLAAGSRLAAGAAAAAPLSLDDRGALDRVSRWPLGREQARGRIEITTDAASAQVSVDGELMGATPLSMTVAPGSHRVRVSAEGRLPVEQELEVAADAVATFHAQ